MNIQDTLHPVYPYHCLVSDLPVVRAVCNGVPVYAFGYAHIFGSSPQLVPRTPLQQSNDHPFSRICLKKSNEITFNHLGTTTPRMPRLTQNDYRPLEPVHLIDGDPETCWSSRTQPAHDSDPSWIRLDLAVEAIVHQIVLRKRKPTLTRNRPGSVNPEADAVEVGQAMTDHLEIRLSRDGKEWVTVFNGSSNDNPEKYDFTFSFSPTMAKQVLIIGSMYHRMENLLYCFSISCVEVYTPENENLALVSQGTGITVSSVLVGGAQEIESHRWYWPIQYDMGLKWARIGYHDDTINWHWVEQEKGVLAVDPITDASITELVQNGIHVVMCLNFGNRLYQGNRARRLPQLWEWYYENPEPPKTDEALAAWVRYIRFMVDKYRDRVQYFEIWNEWNIDIYWGDLPDVMHYIKISNIAIKVIRELAPQAKIMMGSISGFPYGLATCSPDDLDHLVQQNITLQAIRALAKSVDVIGYHPFYAVDPDSTQFLGYVEDVKAFKSFCNQAGFTGAFMASEFNVSASYPAPEGKNWWGSYNASEIQKAKYCSRIAIMHTALDVGSFFCETWSSNYPMDLSLLRRSSHAYPVTPMQPSAAYYVTRNLSTLLDDFHGCDVPVVILPENAGIDTYSLQSKSTLMIALWLRGRACDQSRFVSADVQVPDGFTKALGLDTVNGEEQILDIVDGTIKQVLVRDYPILIRFM